MEANEHTFGSYFRELRSELTGYVEARIELARFSAYEKVAHFTSKALIFLVIGVLVSLIILFVSVTAAVLIGKLLDEPWMGFASISGFYLLVFVIAWFFKDRFIQKIHSATLEVMMQTEEEKKAVHENAG